MLTDVRTGSPCKLRYVTLRGIPALEVQFDDASGLPFRVTRDNRQSDRLIPWLHQTMCCVLAYT